MTDQASEQGLRKPRSTTGWRARVRRTRGGALALKAGVFVLGLAFIALGAAALVLPGPLTIPPILIGLLIWSTEFAWADKLVVRARKAADAAWAQAKRKPVTSTLITVGGLVAAVVVIVLVIHYDLVDRAKDAVGLS